jgi:hypothetical protein
VSKSSDTPEKEAEAPAPEQADKAPQSQADAKRQQVRVEIDDSNVVATYANFCRVMGTPEELIIDFGVNPQPFGVPTSPIPVTQRVITNFYTAKRMAHALQLTLQRHEATFGVLETDVQKRVKPGMMQQNQPPANK